MATLENLIKEHWIDPKVAARHAAFHLHMAILANTPGMTAWRGFILGDASTIQDLNGQPLFHDFPVLSPEGNPIGTVRASASRVLGVPVLATYLGGPRWDLNKAAIQARAYVERTLKGKVIATRHVCYAYPKLGIEVKWEETNGASQRTIIDVGDGSVVSEKVEPGMRGTGVSSFYGGLPEKRVPEAVKRFGVYDSLMKDLKARSRLELAAHLDLGEFQRAQSVIIELMPSLWTSKVLTFCTHGFSHECFRLHSQPMGGYCVPAACQMILDFWRYYYSIEDIALVMKTGTTTIYADEVAGLKALTCSHFDAQHDSKPTFNKVKGEINANRPFDYSFPLHATACAGYKEVRIKPLGPVPEQSIYLYDPWPSNVGSLRWETYFTWGTDGFVYLRRP
jgi:hypothetical protein